MDLLIKGISMDASKDRHCGLERWEEHVNGATYPGTIATPASTPVPPPRWYSLESTTTPTTLGTLPSARNILVALSSSPGRAVLIALPLPSGRAVLMTLPLARTPTSPILVALTLPLALPLLLGPTPSVPPAGPLVAASHASASKGFHVYFALLSKPAPPIFSGQTLCKAQRLHIYKTCPTYVQKYTYTYTYTYKYKYTYTYTHTHTHRHTCNMCAWFQCCLAGSSQQKYSHDACFSCKTNHICTALLILCMLVNESLALFPAEMRKNKDGCVSVTADRSKVMQNSSLDPASPSWMTIC